MTVRNLDSAPTIRLFNDDPVKTLSNDELGDRLEGYASQIASLTARFLEILAEFDARSAWNFKGIRSTAHWLCWRTGMTMRTAQEHVRIARALTELPETKAAFDKGQLTYSKVRALTRVATPEREPELVNVAKSASASQVERVVRAIRTVDKNLANEDRATPEAEPEIESTGRWRWNSDGSLSVNLRLSALDGAAFLAGTVRAEYERTRIGVDPDVPRNGDSTDATDTPKSQRDLWRHVPGNIAPAVVTMADTLRTIIDIPTVAPGAEVIVHTHTTGSEPGSAESPNPHLDNGPALTDGEVAEASCHASVSKVVDVDGVRLWWGRDRRVPTRRLVQLIVQRDRCCQHPGCGRTRHLHIHHVKAWSRGGTTDPDNLILLCSSHHRALHHGVFAIIANSKQQFTFHAPDGTVLEQAPPLEVTGDWTPDRSIAPNATVPVNGGRLHLDYVTEVLYRSWDYRDRHQAAA